MPTPTPTKSNGTASNSREHNGPSTSRIPAAAVGVVRQLRTNRNTVVDPHNASDEDNDSDDEPLASSQGSQPRQQSK